jgi:hypothetical protein
MGCGGWVGDLWNWVKAFSIKNGLSRELPTSSFRLKAEVYS